MNDVHMRLNADSRDYYYINANAFAAAGWWAPINLMTILR